MKKVLEKLKITTKIIAIHNLLYLIFGAIVYPLIPYLLNYPPNSIDNQFQTTVVGMQYTNQFILLLILGLVMNAVILYFYFRQVNNWDKYKKESGAKQTAEVLKTRNVCANGIYKLIPVHIIITLIVLFLVLTIASTEILLTLKLAAIICIWTTIADLLLYVFTGKIFDKILKESYEYIKGKDDTIIRSSLDKKLLIQSVSCILVALFVLTIFAYSRILVERGAFLKEKEFTNLHNKLELIRSENTNPFEVIKTSGKGYFILDMQGNELYTSTKISKFAKEYILHYPYESRLYCQYASSSEGVFQKVSIEENEYYIGKIYEVMPQSYTIIFLLFDSTLLILYIIIINFFSKNIKYQLDLISERLDEIGEEKNNVGTQLAITSNDEFSDLIKAYNKIQQNTKDLIDELKEKQDIIVKQGQLVSIGELAGGVAHDINTPISAIKTGIIMLTSMTSDKTAEEKEILQRMDNCATKIINIVNSMRNQIRNLGGDTNVKFKISDVVNDIKIITYHEISKNKSNIEIEIQDDVSIQGDPTKLGQVFTNLVVNAAQAYDEKGGKIKIIVRASKANAQIEVIDFAGGLDDSIAPYVFKNILTTKGTYGTGLGLYLAYSVIKGEFNGEIAFDTKKGEGTTFHISIPLAEKTVEDTK